MPYRGGKLDQAIPNLNLLSNKYPVVLLRDLDMYDCPPQLIARLIPSPKSENFIVNIATDEAEAWLLGDSENFAEYFGIPIGFLPGSILKRQNGPRTVTEIDTPYKTSQYFVRYLLPLTTNQTIFQQLQPKVGAVKGAEYNHVMLPFIRTVWNPETARLKSHSLNRMILRLSNFKGPH